MRAWLPVFLAACATSAVVTPAPPPPVPAAPVADAEVCLTLQRAFQARLDVATGVCAADLECGCYAGVAPGLGCGGVADYETTKALAGLQTQFVAAHCTMPETCPSPACTAVCEAGRCVQPVLTP